MADKVCKAALVVGFLMQGVSNWVRGPIPSPHRLPTHAPKPPRIVTDELKSREFKCYYCPYEYTYQDYKDYKLSDKHFWEADAECPQCYTTYRNM